MGIPLSPKPWDEIDHRGLGFQPGDWCILKHVEGEKCPSWDNCEGHFYVVLPNGILIDLGGRASNCTLPNDRTHRCWVISGEAPKFTAGKNGPTCSAGAGSILVRDYHGFLINGELT